MDRMFRLRLLAWRLCLPALSWGIVGLAAFAANPAKPLTPHGDDTAITRAVRNYLSRKHLIQHAVDDEISKRCFDTFLKNLDPGKAYFTRADIAEFKLYETRLDDQINQNKLSFAYQVFNRFQQRIDERVVLIKDLLAQPVDFSVDEEMVKDAKDQDYAATDAEIRELWRKRIKYDLLVRRADKQTDEEARQKITKKYESFAKRMHQIDAEELREIYLSSLTGSYDPHSTYMSASTNKSFQIKMSLELEGIGAELKWDDGAVIVNNLVEGGAAAKEGHLKAGDRIIRVGQDVAGEMVDVEDMKLTDVVDLIRGKRGTTVRLEVVPAGETASKTISIQRAKIELHDEEARAKVFPVEGPNQQVTRVGVIEIPSFYMDMERYSRGFRDYKSMKTDVDRLLRGFKAEEVDVVVLDLRGNGGGSLIESIAGTGLFIDQGTVVQVKQGSDVEPYDDTVPGTSWDGPLVVLVSKLSASASEILAGAIQDYERGIIVGDPTTHGKGTVQGVFDVSRELFGGLRTALPELGSIKLTEKQFYLPSGRSTQLKGVASDIVLPSIFAHLPVGEDELDYAVPWNTVPSSTYQRLGLVNKEMLRELRNKSMARVAADPEFTKDQQKIARYLEQKEVKSVTLNEAKYLAEREKFDSDKSEEEALEETLNENKKEIVLDYYLKEVLNIAADYAQMSHQKQLAGNN